MAFLIGGANSAATGGYEVANSCRFAVGDSAYMHKTLGTATNEKKFTFSAWVKRGKEAGNQQIFNVGPDGSDTWETGIRFRAPNDYDIHCTFDDGSQGSNIQLITTTEYRDRAAWMHIVFAVDTTQAVAANRMKMYVNGVQQNDTYTYVNTYPDQNTDCDAMDSGNVIAVGRRTSETTAYFDGYMAEVVFVDGTAYAASDFGEYDEDSPDIWKPKDVSSLTFGNNGFYLDFEDSSNLGNDKNGGTDLTEVNLAAADQASDTPTNNFCTFNPLIGVHHTSTGVVALTQGNCHMAEVASPTHGTTLGTMGSTKMKFYFEYKLHSSAADISMGVMGQPFPQSTSNHAYNDVGAYGYYGESSQSYKITAGVWATDSTFSGDGIYMFAIDPTNNKLWVGKDGTWDGDPAAGSGNIVTLGTHEYLPWAHCSGTSGDNSISANFGGCPAFAISSGNADADGYGNFEYEVPSGFYSLCTKNLAEYG